jgi:phosphatidylglycerophosphate synthase
MVRKPSSAALGSITFRWAAITLDVSALPAPIGRFERRPVVFLVTGRSAVARVGGISAIRRHVATASRLGLTPIVVYPPRFQTLGAEIDADLRGAVLCVSSTAAASLLGSDDTEALVVAADWFISPAALFAFGSQTRGPAVARFTDRGRLVAPVARVTVGRLRPLLAEFDASPVSELLNTVVPPDAEIVDLEPGERHRLSDSAAIERCERKLFGLGSHRAEPWLVRTLERNVSIPIASQLARTRATPLQVSAVKILVTVGVAYTVSSPGYVAGLVATLLYFVSRVLDAVAGDLARAAVRPKARGDKFDVLGDFVAHLAILWAIAARSGWSEGQVMAAAITTLGLSISGLMTYRRVLKPVWHAHALGIRHRVRRDNFATRFSRANGPAVAFLVSALIGRLDLFLWGTAFASHAFYLSWRRRSVRGVPRDRS